MLHHGAADPAYARARARAMQGGPRQVAVPLSQLAGNNSNSKNDRGQCDTRGALGNINNNTNNNNINNVNVHANGKKPRYRPVMRGMQVNASAAATASRAAAPPLSPTGMQLLGVQALKREGKVSDSTKRSLKMDIIARQFDK